LCEFPSEDDRVLKCKRLHGIIERLVRWENLTLRAGLSPESKVWLAFVPQLPNSGQEVYATLKLEQSCCGEAYAVVWRVESGDHEV
jgi:hypothetical protein